MDNFLDNLEEPSGPTIGPADERTSATPALLYQPRVLSGIQPSEAFHLGHYFGAVRQHIALQHEYPGEAFFVVADYHSLTRHNDKEWLRNATLELASAYLALGLDPNKSFLYRQSDVPQTLELYWILSCFSYVNELLRNPTFEEPEYKESRSAGLLTYPVLMAADILGLRATIVPVGHDQSINIEKVRDVTTRFNHFFKTDLFPIPNIRLTATARVLGTDGRKMNSTYKNTINPFASNNVLRRQVASIKTDSTPRNAPKDPLKCTVFHLYSLVASGEKVELMRERYEKGSIGYAEAKEELTSAIAMYFAEAADKYYKIKADPDKVFDVLREGFRLAAEQTEITVDAVRQMTGLAD